MARLMGLISVAPIVLPILVFAGQQPEQQQASDAKEAPSPAKDEIRRVHVQISTAKEAYKQLEPIRLDYQIGDETGPTESPLYFMQTHPLPAELSLHVQLEGVDVPPTSFSKGRGGWGISGRMVPIGPPDRPLRGQIIPNRFYDMTRPGLYSVSIDAKVGALRIPQVRKGRGTSNTLNIYVQPRQELPDQSLSLTIRARRQLRQLEPIQIEYEISRPPGPGDDPFLLTDGYPLPKGFVLHVERLDGIEVPATAFAKSPEVKALDSGEGRPLRVHPTEAPLKREIDANLFHDMTLPGRYRIAMEGTAINPRNPDGPKMRGTSNTLDIEVQGGPL